MEILKLSQIPISNIKAVEKQSKIAENNQKQSSYDERKIKLSLDYLSNQGKSSVIPFKKQYTIQASGSRVHNPIFSAPKDINEMEKFADKSEEFISRAKKRAEQLKDEEESVYSEIEILQPSEKELISDGIIFTNYEDDVQISELDEQGNIIRTSLFDNGELKKISTQKEEIEFKDGKLRAYSTNGDYKKEAAFNKKGEATSYVEHYSDDGYAAVSFQNGTPVNYIKNYNYEYNGRTKHIVKTVEGRWIRP